MAALEGITLPQQRRTVRDIYGKRHETFINVYPRALLDRAVARVL